MNFNIFRRKQKKLNKVNAEFILPTGRKHNVITELDNDGTIEYEDGKYETNKDARLLDEDNIPTFVYIKGISSPIQFSQTKGLAEIKVCAKALKAILKKKLFYDLFRDYGGKTISDIIFDVLLIANLVCSVGIFLVVTGIADGLLSGTAK